MTTLTYTENISNSLYTFTAFNHASVLTKHFDINFVNPLIVIPISIFPDSDSFNTMLASEKSLAKNWDNSIEDKAWAHL